MEFDLSSDQVALRDAAAALLDRYAAPEVVRKRVGTGTLIGTSPGAGTEEPSGGDAPSGYDHELWSAMVDQGWLGIERPEAEGGLGMGMVEVAVLCEEIGRHVAPAPFLSTVLSADAIAQALGAFAGGREGPDRGADLVGWLERLTAGAAVGALAWGADKGDLAVTERAGGVELRGRPDPVLYGPSADVAVLVTADAAYLVVPDPGRRPTAEPAMDRTRELGWLELGDATVWRLGGGTEADRLIDRAATGFAAEQLGTAAKALEMAVAYAKERVQFGKPIGSFQAIKHRLADALVDVEGMRSTVYYAAWCVSVGDPEASLAASMAKAWCSDASRRVLSSCLQVHGGIGFTWEHDLHLYLKRAQLDQVSFGDAAWHRERLAAMLRRRVERGQGVL